MIGRQIAHYRIDAALRAGGMGEVWRGINLRSAQPVALKTVRLAAGADWQARQRFLAETKLAPRVHHPYVVSVLDVVDDVDERWLVMELVEGPTLDEYLKAQRPSRAEIARLMAEVAEALAAIHAQGIVHRDLKPRNILVASAHVKVTDFGVAQDLAPTSNLAALHGTTSPIDLPDDTSYGTIAYMSPEQLRRRGPVDTRSDLFALGVVLLEALSGIHPFLAADTVDTVAAICRSAPRLGAERQHTPLQRYGLRLVAKHPDDRPESAQRVAADLHELARQEATRGWRTVGAGSAAVFCAVSLLLQLGRPPGSLMEEIALREAAQQQPALVLLSKADSDSSEANLSREATELLTSSLRGSPTLRIVNTERLPTDLAQTSSDPEWIRRVANATEANYFVTTHVEQRAALFQAAISLFSRGAFGIVPGSPRVTRVFEAGDLAGLVNSIGPWLVTQISGPTAAAGLPSPTALFAESPLAETIAPIRRAIDEGRLKEAIEQLESLWREYPRSRQVGDLLARVHDRAGNEGRAKEVALNLRELLLGASPEDPLTWSARSAVERILGQPEEALAAALRLRNLLPVDQAATLEVAEHQYAVAAYAEAVESARAAIALDRLDPRAWLTLAKTLVVMGRTDLSGTALQRAEELCAAQHNLPGLAQIEGLRGYLESMAGRLGEAIRRYRAGAARFKSAGLNALAAIDELAAAELAYNLGQYEAAGTTFLRLQQTFLDNGQRRFYIQAVADSCAIALGRDQPRVALANLRLALSEARETRNHELLISVLRVLAAARFADGDGAGALEAAEEWLTNARALASVRETNEAEIARVRANGWLGRIAVAEELAAALRRRSGAAALSGDELLELDLTRAEAAIYAERPALALSTAEAAAALARETQNPTLRTSILLLLARARQLAGDLLAAQAALADAEQSLARGERATDLQSSFSEVEAAIAVEAGTPVDQKPLVSPESMTWPPIQLLRAEAALRADDFNRTLALADSVLGLARCRPSDRTRALCLRAYAAAGLGRIEDARRAAADGLVSSDELGLARTGWRLASLVSSLAATALERQRYEQLGRQFQQSLLEGLQPQMREKLLRQLSQGGIRARQ